MRALLAPFLLPLGASLLLGLVAAPAARAQDPLDEKPAGSAPTGGASSSSSSGGPAAAGTSDGRSALALGFTLGSPLGLAGSFDLGNAAALRFSLGAWGNDDFGGYLDAVVRPVPRLAGGTYGALYLNVGGGVAVSVDSNGNNRGNGLAGFSMYNAALLTQSPYFVATPANLGVDVHATLGIDLAFPEAPLDLFFHFSPSVLVVPTLGIGARGVLGALWHL